MGIGTSLVLIAVGAILKWAVTASVSGVELATVGTILLVIGVIGLVISLLLMSAWGRRDAAVVRDRTVVERDPIA
jgi:sulfite exporter TauE/SafE